MADVSSVMASTVQYQTVQDTKQPSSSISDSNLTQSLTDVKNTGFQAGLVQEKDSPSKLPEDMEKFLVGLNDQLNQLKNTLSFEQDENSNRMLILVKDRDSGEVIRQIPSDEFLSVSKNITDFLETVNKLDSEVSIPPGILTSEKA